MNRRWSVLFLILTLLTGCAGKKTETAPSEALLETKPTDCVGFSDYFDIPGTDGALQATALNTRDADGLRLAGGDILVFSGYKATALTLLAENTLLTKAEATLSCQIFPEDPAITAGTKGITYVDSTSRELVFLNSILEELERIPLPDGCGNAVLSADQSLLYYCTADALRVLNLDTGTDRPVREMHFPCQEVMALHCGETVIQCSATYDDGTDYTLFFSAETGAFLYETQGDVPLWTAGDLYFSMHMDGEYRELICGSPDFGPSVLVTETEAVAIHPLPDQRIVLLQSQDMEGRTVLDCYHLETGARTAQVTLPEPYRIRDILPDPRSDRLWLLCHDRDGDRDVLCRWDLQRSDPGDPANYLQLRWDREQPDKEGLAQCGELAKNLSDRHQVRILIWTDAAGPDHADHQLVPEYQVPLICRELQELDKILSMYPKGFLKELAAFTASGRLNICLVRSICSDDFPPESLPSLLHWDDNADVWLYVTPGQDLAQQVHRLLFDIIDCRVLSICNVYDGWNHLNPSDNSPGSTHLDRVRIMENAITEDREAFFASGFMQATLRHLCAGIREAFPTAQSADKLPWEQYLEELPTMRP